MRLPLLVVLLVVSLAACSSKSASDTASGSPSPGATNAAALLASDPAVGSAAANAKSGVEASQSSPKASPLPSGPSKKNTMPLRLSLNRTCARVGDEMRATAVTEANAKLAFAAAYSDNTLVPDFTYVPADGNATGEYTWAWVIRPDIPPGDALLSVVASKGNKGASYDQPFRIATTC